MIIKKPAKKKKQCNCMITDEDDLIKIAALLCEDETVDPDASGVFELFSTDALYVFLISTNHTIAAIFEYVNNDETDGGQAKTNFIRQVSEEYFLSVREEKTLDTVSWLVKVCEECDCMMCQRVHYALTTQLDEGFLRFKLGSAV